MRCAKCNSVIIFLIFDSLTLEDVPPVALVAAQRAVPPGVKLTDAGVDVDEAGVGVYEISGDGYEIDVTPDGIVVEIEEEIGDDKVPGVVTEALELRVPGLQVMLIEKSLRKSLEIYYEFEGEDEQGNVIDVEISEFGNRVVVQQDFAG